SSFSLLFIVPILHTCSFPTRRSSDLKSKSFRKGHIYSKKILCNDRNHCCSDSRKNLKYLGLILLNGFYRFISFCYMNCCPLCVRSEEHTFELQSRFDIVCRLLLEKKK